jgi:hypothetical protein
MQYTVNIAASGTTSIAYGSRNDVDCNGLVAIVTPAELTSTSLSFLVSADGTNFMTHKDYLGTTVTVTCAASQFISLDPALFVGFPYWKVVMGSAEAAARVLTVIVRDV